MVPRRLGPGVRELQARLRQVDRLFDGPTGTYDDLTVNVRDETAIASLYAQVRDGDKAVVHW